MSSGAELGELGGDVTVTPSASLPSTILVEGQSSDITIEPPRYD